MSLRRPPWPASLLAMGAGSRLALAVAAAGLLWLAVGWAIA